MCTVYILDCYLVVFGYNHKINLESTQNVYIYEHIYTCFLCTWIGSVHDSRT